MERKRIGVLGGSFDPPTIAHMKVGEVFLKTLGLDEVRYVPARQNPLKTRYAVATPEQRWEMLLMVLKDKEQFSVSDIEFAEEWVCDGKVYVPTGEVPPSYAYSTLTAFKEFEPHTDFIMLGGSDILRNFYQWHNAERLIEEFEFAIHVRPPHSAASTIAPIREEHRSQVTIVDLPIPDMSSTDVRSFFESKDFERARELLAPEIFKYAMDNKIYENPQTVLTNL